MNRPAPLEKRDRSYADAAAWTVILLLSAAFVLLRVRTNGNLNDSVAAQDTRSYFDCAGRNFLSREAYTCGRSATLPFLYGLLTPNGEYELTVMAEPFFGSEARLAVQPGTEKIVRFQLILSIAGWLIFSWSAASLFRNAALKIVSVFLLLAFAFVPQLSDWDSILLSESVSFSLFILMSAFWLRFLNAVFNRKRPIETALLALLTLVSAFFWTFTRDTNAYYLIMLALCSLICGIAALRRERVFAAGAAVLTSLALIGLFIFQQRTFRESERWLLPLLNNYSGNVFPYESRVEWFRSRGIPVSDTLLQTFGSAEYNGIYEEKAFIDWVRSDGISAYIAFMIDHPLLTAQSVYFQTDEFFSENIQPFFYGAEEDKPRWAEPLGNLLHPLSSAVMLIVPALWLILIRRKAEDGSRKVWIVFLLVLTLGGTALTVIAYLGEVRSVWRHVLSGVLMLRLALWLNLLALLDDPERREIRIGRSE